MGEQNRPYDRPADFLARVLPITKGEERFAGNGTEATQTGGGDSRDLLTQSGQAVALSQGTPLTEGYVYTLSFDVIPPTDADGNLVPYACVVQVRFNENGNTQQRMFSLSGAQSISLPGRVLDVRVTDTTPEILPTTSTPTPSPGSKYTVRMVVERGVRPTSSRPVLYNGCFLLENDSSMTFAIPQGVGANTLNVSYGGEPDGLPSQLLVTFKGPGGVGVFKSYWLQQAQQDMFITIPPGATEVVVNNEDASNSTFFSVQWGIDG